ncbi:TIGR03619 family F420-dependent LLM class oxidoreductase [Nocardioides taihuensis]|uniref:TIGR03619 family F420-dependent LLM class oxidoreductase n=1 Tax=Nocardioides taihuensis TaxID=1835606 RepID=A0ABW0BL42_9ACTN
MTDVRLLLVLTENEALTGTHDPRALVEMAVEAEAHGIDGVMLSEHVVLGRDSGAAGEMANPRDYAAPGNQSPDYPWPNSLVVMSAIAQATERLRIVAGAVIAPLRHPLLLAKELGTLDLLSRGRLVVLPTVSWSRDEYAALGVPFTERGKILDEQLDILAKAWGPFPIRHEGRYFSFDDVWLEPGAYTPQGPPIWLGGQGMHPPLIRRLVRHGRGLNPFGPLTDGDLAVLASAMRGAGRDLDELELVGGIRGTFRSSDDLADLGDALSSLPGQLRRGFTTICFKPAMFVRDRAGLPAFYDELTDRVARMASTTGRES